MHQTGYRMDGCRKAAEVGECSERRACCGGPASSIFFNANLPNHGFQSLGRFGDCMLLKNYMAPGTLASGAAFNGASSRWDGNSLAASLILVVISLGGQSLGDEVLWF
jgi:hypothetical protein